MFQLLQQLVESVGKQQLKRLMLQVQDLAQDNGLEVKLVKLETDDDCVYSFFTVQSTVDKHVHEMVLTASIHDSGVMVGYKDAPEGPSGQEAYDYIDNCEPNAQAIVDSINTVVV